MMLRRDKNIFKSIQNRIVGSIACICIGADKLFDFR